MADKIKNHATPYIANAEGKPCVVLGEEPRYKRKKVLAGPVEPPEEALPEGRVVESEEVAALWRAPEIEPEEVAPLWRAPVIEPEEVAPLCGGIPADLVEGELLEEDEGEGNEDIDGQPWEEGLNDGMEEAQYEEVVLAETAETTGEAIRALKAAVCLSSDEEPTSELPVSLHDSASEAAELIMLEPTAPACKKTFTDCREEGSLAMGMRSISLVG